MEKFLENLKKAQITIKTADHLTYMTFPLVKDKRLLLKIIQEIKKGIADCINAILQREYLYKRISLYKDPKTNFKIFRQKCAARYNITDTEINLILELFEIVEKHRESPMEFVRGENIVILSENMSRKTISVEKVKDFLALSKSLIKKAEYEFLRKV